jgi:hypothetical protein
MIIGFPYQDRDRILREFEQLTALEPSLCQILIYFAFPGTPFHRRLVDEKLYLPEYRENPDYRKFDGFSLHFAHPHFTPPELEALQRELYRRDFETLGPSLVRMVRVWFEGYKNLRRSPSLLLRKRSEKMRSVVRNSLPALYPATLFGPNRARRTEARVLFEEILGALGGLSRKERALCLATLPFSAWTALAARLKMFQQPRLLRVEHSIGSAPASFRQKGHAW